MNKRQMITETRGKFFRVEFRKKDGSIRVMNGRLGVKKHLHGGKLRYNPADLNMMVVFDCKKKDYRMVNLDTLISFSCGKVAWRTA